MITILYNKHNLTNKPISKLKIKDFDLSYDQLAFSIHILYYDEITKQTHTIR